MEQFSQIVSLSVAILCVCAGSDQALSTEKQSELSSMAATKRAAVFKMSTSRVHSFGVFISGDGLALAHLQAVATDESPKIALPDGSLKNECEILGVFPAQELVLLKLEHNPSVWLSLAASAPDVDAHVALIPLNNRDPWDSRVPPVTGRVMAKRRILTANLKDVEFVRTFSLGTAISPTQRDFLGPGRFAVSEKGELTAFTAGTTTRNSPRMGTQTLIDLAPIAEIGDTVASLASGGRDLGCPLPKDINPVDPASMDELFHSMNLAGQRGDSPEFARLHSVMLKRYPDSILLQSRIPSLFEPEVQRHLRQPPDIDELLRKLQLNPNDSTAVQVARLSTRTAVLALSPERVEDAVETCRRAIEMSPRDYADDRLWLAHHHAQNGELEKSERLLKDVYESASDDIMVLESLGYVLTRLGKQIELQQLAKREAEVISVYRTRNPIRSPWPLGYANTETPSQVSDSHLKQFRTSVLRAFRNNDLDAFAQIIDWDFMRHAIIGEATVNAESVDESLTIARATLARSFADWARRISSEEGTSISFRGLIRRDSKLEAVLRVTFAEGVNQPFHDHTHAHILLFTLRAAGSGELLIADFQNPTLGFSTVTTHRDMFSEMSAILSDTSSSQPDTLTRFHRNVIAIPTLPALFNAGRQEEVMETIEAFTPVLRSNNRIRVIALRARLLKASAGHTNRTALAPLLAESVEELSERIAVKDYFLRHGHIAAAEAEIEGIRKIVGPDALLDTELALACLTHDKVDAARKFADRAVRAEPEHRHCQQTLLIAAAVNKDFQTAIQALNRLDAMGAHSELSEVESDFRLAGLTASPEYASWRQAKQNRELQVRRQSQLEANAIFKEFEQSTQR